MKVYHFCTSVNEANAYMLMDADSREALLIDVPEWTDSMEQLLTSQQAILKGVFITHEHYDHISGLKKLKQKYNRLEQYPQKDKIIKLGEHTGIILPLPGHTPESAGLYIAKMVFTGDALFAGSVGGTVSPHEARQQIEAIKANILTLPDDTFVFPGHGPISSVGIEKKYNPFLQS